jgi:iron(III) transport system permease protein
MTLMVAALVAAAVALLPVVYLVDRVLDTGFDATRDEIWQRRTYDLVVRSLTLTVVVTVACVVIGVACALVVARADLPGRTLWHTLLVVPLAVPSYLFGYAWISWRPGTSPLFGASVVLTLVSYPYVYLPVVAALRRCDPALEEVSRSLGRGRVRTLLVTLAQTRASIAAGALLVALYVLSDFGAVAIMRYEAFTWVIYGAYNAGFTPGRAAILALVLVALATILVVGEGRARGRAASRVGSGAPRRPLVERRSPAARAAATVVVAAPVALGVGFPVVSMVRWLARPVDRDVEWSTVASALWSTLGVALLGALLTMLLAVPVGLAAARYRNPTVRAVERSTYIVHALPGIVIGISMVYVGVKLLEPIYLRTPLLVLAYAVLFLPLAVGSVRAAVEVSPVGLEEVARSLGRTTWGAWRDITMPLAAPGVAAGAALVLVTATKELPVTLILHPTGMETLSMAVWKYTAVSDYGNAAPYAAVLLVAAALPTVALSRLAGVHRS